MRSHQTTETNWRALTMLSLASLVNGAATNAQDVNLEKSEQIAAKTIDVVPITQQDTIVTLDGERVRGSITTKNQDAVFIMKDDGNLTSIATSNILKLCITGESNVSRSLLGPQTPVTLVDGSLFYFSNVTFSEGGLNATLGTNHQVKIPRHTCGSIAFNEQGDYGVAWQQFLKTKPSFVDQIAVRKKGGVLEPTEGQVYKLSDSHLDFVIDGNILHIPLAKLSGVVFRSSPLAPRDVSKLISINQQRIFALDLSFDKEKILIETAAGVLLELPREPFEVDFSVSKAKSLGDLETKVKTWNPLSPSNHFSMLKTLFQPHVVPFYEQKPKSRFAHNSSQVELRGELELEIPIRKEYTWLHGKASLSTGEHSMITFAGDDVDLLTVPGACDLVQERSFVIPLSGVHTLKIEVAPGTVVTLSDFVFVKKD